MPQVFYDTKNAEAANADLVASLDVTREVHVPKSDESMEIFKEKNKETATNYHAILDASFSTVPTSSFNKSGANVINTIVSKKHASITFASVFKNRSMSLAQSFDANNDTNVNASTLEESRRLSFVFVSQSTTK